MEIILIIYFYIALLTAFISGVFSVLGHEIEDIDGIWDWLVYSLFWIKQPIKSLIKILTSNWK